MSSSASFCWLLASQPNPLVCGNIYKNESLGDLTLLFPSDLTSFFDLIRQHGDVAYSLMSVYAASHSLLLALFAGYAAHAGALSFGTLIAVCWFGSFTGDVIRFWIGRRYGRQPARRPASPTPSRRWSAAATRSTRVENVFYALSGAHTNDAILAIEREIAPLSAKHWDKIRMDEALFRRIDTLHRAREQLALTAEEQRVLERYHAHYTRAGAALDPAAKQRLAAINERLAVLDTTLQPERARRRAELRAGARRRGRPRPACPISCARPRAKPPTSAVWRASTSSRCRAPASSRSCNSRPGAICAKNLPRLDRARRRRRRDRQQGDHRRDGGAAHRARAAARLSDVRPLPARRRHGQDAGGGARAARADVGAARMSARRRDRDALQAIVQAEGGNFEFAPWDWRYYAEKLRKARCDLDESDGQAVFPARPHHRSGVLHRQQAVRPELRGAHRHPGLASRRAGVGGARRRRPPPRACSSATISRAAPSIAAPG